MGKEEELLWPLIGVARVPVTGTGLFFFSNQFFPVMNYAKAWACIRLNRFETKKSN